MAAKESSPSSALLGRERPRLYTQPARRLTRKTTLGYEAAAFAEDMLGMQLLPWQRWWLLHALELEPGGGFRHRVILTLVARQSGKTTLLKALSLYFAYMGRARLILGSAQSLDIAREAWQGAVELAESDPELRAEIDSIRRVNGEQELRLTSGARYRIAASTRSSGRGLSVDLLILDELREQRTWDAWGALSKTTMARPNALTVAISNAGDDQSVVLNQLRATALAGTDPTLAIFEWSAPEGCDLDDRRAWAQANPGLGYTITEQALASALSTDPPATFRTECLCQHVTQLDGAIDLAAWHDCADPNGNLEGVRGRVAACLDISPDLAHVTLSGAAVLDDGRVRTEVIEAWDSTEAARQELPELLAKVKPRVLGWMSGGPAASLASDLRGIKGARELKAAEVVQICQEFSEQVQARRILQPADALLDAQASAASKLYSGDGWRFGRKGGHVDAVYACAGAVHLARTLPPPKPKLMIVSAKRRKAA